MIRKSLVLLLAAASLSAQAPFEGSISMTVTDNGKPHEFVYMMKGGKIRFDAPGGRGEAMGIIVDPASKKMLMLMTSEKMYMERDFGAAADAAVEKAKPASVKRTGKTETIAGYKCEHVLITEDDGSTSDACVASGIGSFWMMGSSGRGNSKKEAAWETDLGAGSFPLKVQKGATVILEVTKIEKKSLDAALFAPPAGFEKFDMKGMGKRPMSLEETSR